ncbi:MAG: helix-turn-helix domain-containing protein [Phyllobacteriaceae bacterium]|nr:helix-turn-helix domain-containing protein [Phyllobacteriaceae bacterium]
MTYDQDIILNEMAKSAVLSKANRNTISILGESSRIITYFPDEPIVMEGDSPQELFLIIDGIVALGAHHHERETILSLMERGSFLLLQAVITKHVYLQSAKAITRATLLAIPATKFRAAIASDPALAMATMSIIASDHRDSIRDLKNMKLRSSSERLANWILENTQIDGHLELKVNKQLLADKLGMTSESLSRCLRLLQSFGITNKRHSLVVNDEPLLRKFARPSTLIDKNVRH